MQEAPHRPQAEVVRHEPVLPRSWINAERLGMKGVLRNCGDASRSIPPKFHYQSSA